MCEVCKKVVLREAFRSPKDYLNCLAYLRELVDSGEFTLEPGPYGLDEVKDEEGRWRDDIISHVIRCNACGQAFSCGCDTYHGRGGFRKGR